jgi:hypothetical protein
MKRTIQLLITPALAVALLAGCSKSDEQHAKQKAREAGQEMKQELTKAGDEIKQGVDKAKKEIKKGIPDSKGDADRKR